MARKKGDNIHGFLNFYKPKGMSSNQAVGFIRNTFNAKKAGHGGTLDPLAEGILPIALGEATKMLSYMLSEDKYYRFELTFGKSTTTYDTEGEFTNNSSKRPSKEELEREIKNFTGEIEQTPPIFSALKINGKRACDRARNGEKVELPSRKVTIFSLKIETFTKEKATLIAHVSKGTYIRSLGHDIGQNLGCYAHISKLIRTKVPPFDENNTTTKEMLDLCNKIGQSAKTYLLDVDYVLADIPVYTASNEQVQTLLQGKILKVNLSNIENLSTVRVKTEDGKLASLAIYENESLKPNKNFPLLLE